MEAMDMNSRYLRHGVANGGTDSQVEVLEARGRKWTYRFQITELGAQRLRYILENTLRYIVENTLRYSLESKLRGPGQRDL